MDLQETPPSSTLALYARLLLVAQKNLLLVGAPGVGKTRLARLISRRLNKKSIEPILIVGRDGLTFDYLMLHYVLGEDGKPIEVLGDLAKAIISSWIMIISNLGVRELVFDEVNRCNVELVLGDIFTALDIEHRGSIPVIKGRIYNKVAQMMSKDRIDSLKQELGLEDIDIEDNALSRLKEFFKRVGGITLPFSFRIIATMNMYDRAQLYRLGYAMQRRFAVLYMPTLFEKIKVKPVNKSSVDEAVNEIVKKEKIEDKPVYKALIDKDSLVVRQALRELYIDEEQGITYDFEDYPMIIKPPPREVLENELGNILQRYASTASALVAYTYSKVQEMGLEIGVSVLVDAVKVYVAPLLSSTDTEPVIDASELADLVLSSLVIPQLSVVIPRVRSELLLAGTFESSTKTAKLLKKYINEIKSILGNDSLSARLLEGYVGELPGLSTS